MKNLVIHRQYRRDFPFFKLVKRDDPLFNIYSWKCAVNTNNGDLYVLLDTRLYTLPIDSERECHVRDIAECKNLKVVGFEYCITTQQLYCAYDNGDIARLDATTEYSEYFEYEVVATFDSGLQCMTLSPDHEIITAVTGTGTVITMVSDFQVISEVNLYSSDFGDKQFITVGWGKKDTQFHGSEGKAAAKAKPEPVNVNESDDGLARITWRGDGSLFAVSFLHASSKIRQFKVFNRQGQLQYTSESTNGLEECLAWKPSGNLIAAPQRLINKVVVALFEKNGLRHREFSLPFEAKEVTVKDLFWSPDSDILAIVCEQSDTKNAVLQLWTENNYHWYLKQTINFSVQHPLMYATWSSTGKYNKKELILLTPDEIIVTSFDWCVNHSRGNTVNDNAVVGVIDGKRILITSFRDKIVPPPMAHLCLELEEPINAIVFAPDINMENMMYSNTFCTISCNNKITFFEQKKDSSTEYKICQSYNYSKYSDDVVCDICGLKNCNIYTLHHFLWLSRFKMMYVKTGATFNHLYILSLTSLFTFFDLLNDCKSVYVMDQPVEHIIPSPDAYSAYVITNKSVLLYKLEISINEEECIIPTAIEWREPCCHVETVKIGSNNVIVAQSYSNCLLIDGKEVTNNITSFYVHSKFLLLTTLQHTLICIPLNKSGMEQLRKHDLTIKPWEHTDKTSFADISIGRIERGSQIIIAIPQGSKTILQMPRGNLECIEPRPLLLCIVGFHLDNCDYQTATDLVKKHYINPNLIYDHDPELFMNNAEKFIEDNAKAPSWLCRFLSELQDEDVTATMYASCYQGRSVQSNAVSESNGSNVETKADKTRAVESKTVGTKIDKICKILRDIMEKRDDADDLIQPILLSYMKDKEGAGLELALKKFKEVKATQNSDVVGNAFACLQFAANTRVLFDTALGIYDCELAMFIASKSQMDPKEYIPFLKNLNQLEEDYMKYSIDMHLSRYNSALVHLSKVSNRFEECVDLICNQKLYETGLKLFERSSPEYKRVAIASAEYFLSKRMYPEAATMFTRGEDFQRALDAYLSAGYWHDCIILSTKLNLSRADLNELYRNIVERLKLDRKHKEASEVLRYYLNDIEEAVAVVCEGKYWKRALRIAYDARRLDLIDTHIKPGVIEHVEHSLTQLTSLKEDFIKYKSRLSVVRAQLRAKQMSTTNENVYSDALASNKDANRDVMDFLSDAASVPYSVESQRSRASGRSYRSSKNRRKQERKFLSLKEGSMFEDLGLIHRLYEIVVHAGKRRADEWSELAKALIHLEFDDSLYAFQEKLHDFFKLVETSRTEIWDRTAPTSLKEMEKMAAHTPVQLPEINEYFKLADMYITHPPPELKCCNECCAVGMYFKVPFCLRLHDIL